MHHEYIIYGPKRTETPIIGPLPLCSVLTLFPVSRSHDRACKQPGTKRKRQDVVEIMVIQRLFFFLVSYSCLITKTQYPN